jgi:copper chaperone
MTKLTMEITGMSCGHCVSAVTRTLKGLDGVEVGQVEIGSAAVEYDPSRLTPAQIAQAITDEGYAVVGTH